jgi:hypothetical protein
MRVLWGTAADVAILVIMLQQSGERGGEGELFTEMLTGIYI